MVTKAELEEKLHAAEVLLEEYRSNTNGVSVSNCHIECGDSPEVQAIANAVAEGMKALQGIAERHTYGMYFGQKPE